MKIFLFALIMLMTHHTYAFKGSRCYDKVIVGPARGLYKSLGGKDHRDGWMIKFFGTTFGSLSSTTSYVSSTGSCAAFAQIQKEKMVYIALNTRKVQIEAAYGDGESLETLAYFYGYQNCLQGFRRTLKENYQTIFPHSQDPDLLDQSIQKVLDESTFCQLPS